MWNVLVPTLLELGDVPEQEATEDVSKYLSNVYYGVWPLKSLGKDRDNTEEDEEAEEEDETEEPNGPKSQTGPKRGKGTKALRRTPREERK